MCVFLSKFCLVCALLDTIMLEFKHYAAGSRWRQTTVSRKDHREKGDETDGFYGGIRKLQTKDEISTCRRFWPVDVLIRTLRYLSLHCTADYLLVVAELRRSSEECTHLVLLLTPPPF